MFPYVPLESFVVDIIMSVTKQPEISWISNYMVCPAQLAMLNIVNEPGYKCLIINTEIEQNFEVCTVPSQFRTSNIASQMCLIYLMDFQSRQATENLSLPLIDKMYGFIASHATPDDILRFSHRL